MTLQAAIDGLIAENIRRGDELDKSADAVLSLVKEIMRKDKLIEELEQQVAELEENIHDIGYSD